MSEWQTVFVSEKGTVISTEEGWIGRVSLAGGKKARIDENFISAEAARKAVERTWERENNK